MKPDKVTCENCGKQIDRGRWCSDKCRMAKRRTNEQPEQAKPEQKELEKVLDVRLSAPNPNKPEQNTNPNTGVEYRKSRDYINLTKTDKTFYDRAMKDFGEPYYYFSGNLRKAKCANCTQVYETSLALNKYCSYGHFKEMLH